MALEPNFDSVHSLTPWSPLRCPSQQCRMQMVGSPYRGPLHCLRHLVASEGWLGLTRGLGLTIAREVPGSIVYFGTYEASKGYLRRILVVGNEAGVGVGSGTVVGAAGVGWVQEGPGPSATGVAQAQQHLFAVPGGAEGTDRDAVLDPGIGLGSCAAPDARPLPVAPKHKPGEGGDSHQQPGPVASCSLANQPAASGDAQADQQPHHISHHQHHDEYEWQRNYEQQLREKIAAGSAWSLQALHQGLKEAAVAIVSGGLAGCAVSGHARTGARFGE